MKKSTLLSFATVAAIVATSAGTYAAWDQTEATTAPASVTFREPVAITTSALTKDSTSVDAYGATPKYVGKTAFEVSGVPSNVTNAKMNYTATLKDSNQPVASGAYTADVVETPTDNINSSHEVTVTVTPTETTEGKALGGKTGLTVEVTGTLEATAPAN